MLKDAVKATLPIVALRTRDMINFETVVKHITGVSPVKFTSDENLSDKTLYYVNMKGKKPFSTKTLYRTLAQKGSTLIVVNSDQPFDDAFDCGDLPTPKDLVRSVLVGAFKQEDVPVAETEEFVDGMLPALGGLTLKETAEVIKLTQVREEAVTPRALTNTRRLIIPTAQGLTQVNTDLPVYMPNPEWDAFVEKKRPFFVNENIDPRLVPRGVLLDGDPGTGKTQGAKFLANSWGVPLYRMAADFQSKWVGESEGNLQRILNQAANEAPCVLLIDEVEKLFNTGMYNSGGSGVTAKAMSLLLWFMQESNSRVFVAMTCNNLKVIPPELYREGRVSGRITFRGLAPQEAFQLAEAVLASFKIDNPALLTEAKKRVHNLYHEDGSADLVPHSRINQTVVDLVEEQIAGAVTEAAVTETSVDALLGTPAKAPAAKAKKTSK